MFDILPFVACDDELEAVRSFFCEHGHDLADAALRLGGPAAEDCDQNGYSHRRRDRCPDFGEADPVTDLDTTSAEV
jgi:hypothetical protein